MHVILFSIIISAVILYTKISNHLKSKGNLEEILSNKNFNCFKFHLTFKILYTVIIILGLFSIIVGILNHDNTLVAISIVSVFLFFGELINSRTKFSFYYNNDSFISNGKVIRYKSVKCIIRPRVPFAFYIIKTINNDSYSISPKSFDIIKDKLKLKINLS